MDTETDGNKVTKTVSYARRRENFKQQSSATAAADFNGNTFPAYLTRTRWRTTFSLFENRQVDGLCYVFDGEKQEQLVQLDGTSLW